MRIFLSGATGYLGRHLLSSFAESQHDVVALVNSSSDQSVLGGAPVMVCELGSTALRELMADAGPVDVVVHTAATYGRRGESALEVCSANTLFALELLDAAVHNKVPSFVNTDTALPPGANAYALSKKHFRDWGVYFSVRAEIGFVNIALEYFFGPGDSSDKFISHVIRSCLANLPELQLTPGEQLRDFIYIDDVLSAYDLILDHGRGLGPGFHEFSLGLGHGQTLRQIVELVHSLCGSTTKLRFGALPYRPNEVMTSLANTQALRRLGWQPSFNLHSGLLKTIEWERLA